MRKEYLVHWGQVNGCGDDHLMNGYDENGNKVNSFGQGIFSTESEEIARRVYDAELAYAESIIPKLSSLPWAEGLTDNDAAWKDIWDLRLEFLEYDEDGEVVEYKDVCKSDYFYME